MKMVIAILGAVTIYNNILALYNITRAYKHQNDETNGVGPTNGDNTDNGNGAGDHDGTVL